MIPLRSALRSTLGRKFLMGLSGLALVGFVISHLIGNFRLLWADGEGFNWYGHQLQSFGVLFVIAEVGIFTLILVHAFTGVRLKLGHHEARPVQYQNPTSKGGPSRSTIASRNMIISGVILLIFLIVHLIQFRFGPGLEEGYVTEVKGEQVHDLYRLTVEAFQQPLVVVFYLISMVLLGKHLSHGFWSACQSLGLLTDRTTGTVRLIGYVLALVLAVGFLAIPVVMYLRGTGALS